MSALNNLQLHYFAAFFGNPAAGRGEYVRLLLKDAGVNFDYVRCEYGGEKWLNQKKKLEEEQRISTMPYIVTADGKYYSKTFPVMRFIALSLGKYQGDNEDEYQLLDAYADSINDWISKWVNSTFGGDKDALKSYKEEFVPQAYKTWDAILSDRKGPYILGENVSYPDFALYHIIEEDNSQVVIDSAAYPHLAAFTEAIKNRPNIKKYLATDRE